MNGWHGTFQWARERLSKNSQTATLFRNGSLNVMLYCPEIDDSQIPHDRDELYFIKQGSGVFRIGEGCFPFEPGDVIFVPAGTDHQFAEFSDDLASWIMFYGPVGGETGSN